MSDWTNLSHPLRSGMAAPAASGAPVFRFDRREIPNGHQLSVTHIDMAAHTGTHIDAARHFIRDGHGIDDYPLDKFIGGGVVIDATRSRDQVLGRDELAHIGSDIAAGDIVFLSFNYGRLFGTPRYAQHPYLSIAAAQWLVEKGVDMVAVDLMTPELAEGSRPPGFDWPVHRVLLGNDVLVMENVNEKIAAFVGHRVEVIASPLTIAGADGAPVVPLIRLASDR